MFQKGHCFNCSLDKPALFPFCFFCYMIQRRPVSCSFESLFLERCQRSSNESACYQLLQANLNVTLLLCTKMLERSINTYFFKSRSHFRECFYLQALFFGSPLEALLLWLNPHHKTRRSVSLWGFSLTDNVLHCITPVCHSPANHVRFPEPLSLQPNCTRFIRVSWLMWRRPEIKWSASQYRSTEPR